jgi:hypothetical protein
MTICLWNLFHFNSFQQKKKKKEKIKCPKVNTMICVVGAVTEEKNKSGFVCFTHLVGVSMWPMACQISPNHRFQHNPSLKECSNCNPTRPFGSTITCILSHLHQVQEANNKKTKRQRDKETKRQRDKETKRQRDKEKTHTCVNALEPNEPRRNPTNKRSYHRSERVCTSTPCRLVRQYCVTSSPESN